MQFLGDGRVTLVSLLICRVTKKMHLIARGSSLPWLCGCTCTNTEKPKKVRNIMNQMWSGEKSRKDWMRVLYWRTREGIQWWDRWKRVQHHPKIDQPRHTILFSGLQDLKDLSSLFGQRVTSKRKSSLPLPQINIKTDWNHWRKLRSLSLQFVIGMDVLSEILGRIEGLWMKKIHPTPMPYRISHGPIKISDTM